MAEWLRVERIRWSYSYNLTRVSQIAGAHIAHSICSEQAFHDLIVAVDLHPARDVYTNFQNKILVMKFEKRDPLGNTLA